MEIRCLRAQDGIYRWHLNQALVLRDAEGKVLKFVGTTTDIDDQKRAEEVLRQSEARKTAILDSARHDRMEPMRPDAPQSNAA